MNKHHGETVYTKPGRFYSPFYAWPYQAGKAFKK